MHIGDYWFLYHLILIECVGLLVLPHMHKHIRWMAYPLAIAYVVLQPNWFVIPNTSMHINVYSLLYDSCFFVVGWYYTHKRHPYALLLGSLCFIVYIVSYHHHIHRQLSLLFYGFASWFLLFGLIQQALTNAKYQRWIRYLSDASYWIYLSHLTLLTSIQLFIMKNHWPLAIEFIATVLTTLFVCIASYALLIRKRSFTRYIDGEKPHK